VVPSRLGAAKHCPYRSLHRQGDDGRTNLTDAVLYEADDEGIVTLTLNRPDLRNPITDREVIEALLAALERL
jgi:1,4-dihydroxy-2-naphthoyl-CoA synthase